MNVVFVDDEIEIRTLLNDWFTKRGDNVCCISAVQDLLDFLCENKPDVICLDLYMPQSPGLNLIETIRELSPRTSIVFMTGMATKEIQTLTLERGADAFIAKPFS